MADAAHLLTDVAAFCILLCYLDEHAPCYQPIDVRFPTHGSHRCCYECAGALGSDGRVGSCSGDGHEDTSDNGGIYHTSHLEGMATRMEKDILTDTACARKALIWRRTGGWPNGGICEDEKEHGTSISGRHISTRWATSSRVSAFVSLADSSGSNLNGRLLTDCDVRFLDTGIVHDDRIVRDSLHILMEGSPEGMDTEEIELGLRAARR
ncbi:hypothetical protein GQ600_11149 [Phytophthora cactorum]|nr:hypothetical protein GQ600_11149 [Phytophthora cactorum]